MTHTDQFEEIVKEFEEKFTKKFGANNLELCLVPSISREFKMWAVEVVTDDVLKFLLSKLRHIRQETEKEMMKKVKKVIAHSRTTEETHGIGEKEHTARAQVMIDIELAVLERDNQTHI